MAYQEKISYCRGCNERILWMKTKKGNNIPVNYDPEFVNETKFRYGRMVAHFTTCINAGEYRKGK